MAASNSDRLASDINLVSKFLARPDVKDIAVHESVDCIVVCASQVLAQAEQLFRALEDNPAITKILVIAGGIGHSTQAIYDAVAQHPVFHGASEQVKGLPESRVLGHLLERFFDEKKITSRGCKILFEERSTNCGANASETRKVLEAASIPIPKTCIVVQDPTMLLRTIASFQKTYQDLERPPQFLGCPIFVPKMKVVDDQFQYDLPDLADATLWPKQRFYELLTGEIPRLTDDVNGYGPNGKAFIVHVDVPADVQVAASRLSEVLKAKR